MLDYGNYLQTYLRLIKSYTPNISLGLKHWPLLKMGYWFHFRSISTDLSAIFCATVATKSSWFHLCQSTTMGDAQETHLIQPNVSVQLAMAQELDQDNAHLCCCCRWP